MHLSNTLCKLAKTLSNLLKHARFKETRHAGIHSAPKQTSQACYTRFSVPGMLTTWILEASRRGGLGKTKFAFALMHARVGQSGRHVINRRGRLRVISFGPKQGLVSMARNANPETLQDPKASKPHEAPHPKIPKALGS